MARLLVSVRSLVEARLAVAAGVDLVDIKEPARGSLGAASLVTIRSIVEALADRAPLSCALGELIDVAHDPEHAPAPAVGIIDQLAELPPELAFAKLGLAGTIAPLAAAQAAGNEREMAAPHEGVARGLELPDPHAPAAAGITAKTGWETLWRQTFDRLHASIGRVAVVYVDAARCGAPNPRAVIAAASRIGCQVVLFDTAIKDGTHLLTHRSLELLEQDIDITRGLGAQIVLAGSLTFDIMPQVLSLSPDYVAVRSAVCRGERDGPIDPRRIEALRRIVR